MTYNPVIPGEIITSTLFNDAIESMLPLSGGTLTGPLVMGVATANTPPPADATSNVATTRFVSLATTRGTPITLTGDVSGSGAGTFTATLAASGVTAGSYGGASVIPAITVDAKGRITSVSTNPISGLNPSTTLTGDVTGTGTGTVPTVLATTGVTAGSYGAANVIPRITVDAKGRVTSLSNVALSAPAASTTLTGDVTGTGTGTVPAVLAASGVGPGIYGSAGNVPILTINAKGLVTSATSIAVSAATPSTTLTGDVSGTGFGSVATALAASGVTIGTYGSGSMIPVLTVDAKGRITLASTTAVAPATPTNAQVVAGLGFTPINKAGDSMTGGLTTPSLRVNGGVFEAYQALPASNIDLSAASYFSKTISGTTTLTITNALPSTVNSFMLELTNGGSGTINYWSGVTWAGGVKPALTISGVDLLGFISYNGGATWRGLVLAKAMA